MSKMRTRNKNVRLNLTITHRTTIFIPSVCGMSPKGTVSHDRLKKKPKNIADLFPLPFYSIYDQTMKPFAKHRLLSGSPIA